MEKMRRWSWRRRSAQVAVALALGVGVLLAVGHPKGPEPAVGARPAATPAHAMPHHSFCPGKTHTVFGEGPDLLEPKPGYAAHFVFGQRKVVAGDAPEIKLVDEGTDALLGQNGYVERWKGKRWKRLPNPYADSSVPAILFIVTPGLMTECIGPKTGPHWPSGKYRWVQWYKAKSRNRSSDGRHRLWATFRVIAPRGGRSRTSSARIR